MKNWLNVRTASFLIWVIISIVMIVTMPNLDMLVREKGQTEIPSYTQSQIASKLLTEMADDSTDTYEFIAVFTSGSDEALSDTQLEEVDQAIQSLKDKSGELGITDMLAPSDSEEAEKQLVSEDGTTILTQISVDKSQGTVEEAAQSLRDKTKLQSVDSYYTGTDIVMDDFVKSSQEGIKKTEVIAIVFILVVLVLVFRSPVVPLISLITVGVSYIVSLGIVTQLVDKFDFPFSNFTQVFLIVILFGIGTDYNILLYTRFKEELGKGGHILKAITETYRTAGKTVIYSGIAVFIGFIVLYLAEFKLYQATSAVAIGVAVLLLVLLTLNPFFMAVFGIKMFWPIKTINGHSENKIWLFLSKHSFFRPIVALVLVAAISVPFIIKYSGELNYNDLVEISDDYESKQAINVIENHFPSGFSSPTTLVIKSEDSLATQKGLQDIDQLAEVISNIDGVSKVLSVTRPAGEKIEDLYIQDQTNTLNEGLGSAQEGLGTINEGLSEAEDKLGAVDQNSFDSVQQLIDGTSSMEQGVGQLGDALNQVAQGFENGANGATELATGLNTLKQSIEELSDGATRLQQGYGELENGFSAFSELFTTVENAIASSAQGYAAIEQSMNALVQSNPELASDVNVQTVIGTAKGAQAQLAQLEAKLIELTPQYNGAVASLHEANTAFSQITNGLQQVEAGVGQLQTGANTLATGLQSGEAGVNEISSKTGELKTGLSTVNDGQKQLQDGLATLQDKMQQLQDGLAKSTDGLTEISDGLLDAQDYLGEVSSSDSNRIFYIPQEVLDGEEFEESLNMYMSNDRTMTKMTIILDVNPYSKEAMAIIKDIDEQIKATAKNASLSDAEIALGGKSTANVDLQQISSDDFTRTIVIMMIGIALVLVFITRSIWQPIIIIGSLILAYYTSLGLAELLSEAVLGQSILSWNVPFFSFIMIVTLGVDYSIFLMMRYHEVKDQGSVGIIDASKHIGGVVLSAALILGGTFAALIPSGIITLMQVAILVLIGLVLLSFLMLPVFMPAVMGLTEKLKNLVSRKKE
ncbi:MMPL family transporter [Ureibacillus chungkukjangi]|uniref:MMPL/RND family transporter n=1 Tax=Ureibacillus chungkukjangi TaxID=1202712 RepID=UPI00203FB89E|nr:MMPL family transporter [Ureibacillus chungkukjangi]MCM3389608.1 MMPL family transporter [Ureibacillus chungkukjangi]